MPRTPVGNRGAVSLSMDLQEYERIVRSPAGPVAQLVARLAALIAQEGKRRAPVGAPSKTPEGHPAGWLRSHIWWQSGLDAAGVHAELGDDAVTSPANPFPGEPYPEHIEFPETRPRKAPPFARDARPYLVPAAKDVLARELGGP